MSLYVFDVDGTLTPPARRMSDHMADVFRLWSLGRRYYLTSGSELQTMRQQVPPDIMGAAEGWFPCAGGEHWSAGKLRYKRSFIWPEGLREDLAAYVGGTCFGYTVGTHIEDRGSMICFSIIGRAAGPHERAEYAEFDEQVGERAKIAAELRDKYPDLSVTIGGQISIDIADEGNDKGQILREIRKLSSLPIVFVGDRVAPGGNDYPLADALARESRADNSTYAVRGPDDTVKILQALEMVEHDNCG